MRRRRNPAKPRKWTADDWRALGAARLGCRPSDLRPENLTSATYLESPLVALLTRNRT